MSTHNIVFLCGAILMSNHNKGFYEEINKIIPTLSSHIIKDSLICTSELSFLSSCHFYLVEIRRCINGNEYGCDEYGYPIRVPGTRTTGQYFNIGATVGGSLGGVALLLSASITTICLIM